MYYGFLNLYAKLCIFITPEKWTPLGTVHVFVKLMWFCARLLGVQGHRPVRRLAHLCRNKCSPNTYCTASKPQLRVAVGNLCLCVTRKCVVTVFFHLHEVLSSCCRLLLTERYLTSRLNWNKIMISTFVKNSISLLDDNPFLALLLLLQVYISSIKGTRKVYCY